MGSRWLHAGRYEVGEAPSSPSLMLAVSQDIPIRCFAVCAQKHPYTFFSLKEELRCARRRISSARRSAFRRPGVILLRALLAKNKMDVKDVQVVTIGSDMMPLLTGQVDVVTNWLTNTSALKVLRTGVEMHAGVPQP